MRNVTQVNFSATSPAMETHPVTRAGRTLSELLQDSGNCRPISKQELSLHLLSDSLLSEQQKLRSVLDWAQSFLNSDSEVHRKLCRADRLMLADKEQGDIQEISATHEHSYAAKYHHPVSCAAGGAEVFKRGGGREGGGSMQKVWHLEPSNYTARESNNHICADKSPCSEDTCVPFRFTRGRDEVTWPEYRETRENMRSKEPLDSTPHGSNTCRESRLFIPNHRQRASLSDSNTNQTHGPDGPTDLIKDSTSCRKITRHNGSMPFGTVSNSKRSHKTAGAQAEGDTSGHQMEPSSSGAEGKVGTKQEAVRMGDRKGEVNEDQKPSSAFVVSAKNSRDELESTRGQVERTSCLLKLPATLTVYEQYQLCVNQLHHLKHIEPRCFTEPPIDAPTLPTSGFELKSSATNPEIKKRLNKSFTAADMTKERSLNANHKNQARTKYNKSRATCSEQGGARHGHSLTVKESPAATCAESRPVCQSDAVSGDTHLDLNSNTCGEPLKGAAGGKSSTEKVIKAPVEHLQTAPGDNVPTVEETSALTPHPGSFPKRTGCISSLKGRQSRVRGQNKIDEGRGGSLGLRGASHGSSSISEVLQRSESSQLTKHTKRRTPEDKVTFTSTCRDTHKCHPRTETHSPPLSDLRPKSPSSGTSASGHSDKNSPAGVSACDGWLSLPDEVWLCILTLLPPSDLYRVLQVCSRLHTLATDHTLWKNLKIENCDVTEGWLLSVSRRCPRSVCMYSCSGASLTSFGLEVFFTLCRKSLQELKVTSCMGPGLHGDQMLHLIGQLCDHVSSVDVSWSGATDSGVKALSDCNTGLRLKSVVLNGCHVTDDPLRKLVMRHKESMCRLEVFGCQFLTPSCLQTVYETCPGLQHLNIGQVPKVNTRSLTVMTSQLKSLISLNLTGLQAVTDATVDTLLQSCIKLQSLNFSCCPGVTDLTLYSISKYTPCIRSLDVSGCKAVTDAGVQSLALGCTRLQQLDLSSTSTGNRGVTLLANYCSGHLRTVKLSFCHITSENILKLCRHCKRLEVLHLYGSARLPSERQIREINTTVKVYPLS